MQKFRWPSYKVYNVLYLMVISLILTLLLKGKAAHPGMVLGLVSIIFGLQLISRMLRTTGATRILVSVVFIISEVIACLIVGLGNDSQELWLSTWYAISSILLIIDAELRRLIGRRKSYW